MAVIYSVTVSISNHLAEDWLNWMLEEHIPEVLETGMFTQYHLYKLAEPTVDPQTTTYNVQYHCQNMDKLNYYREHLSPPLQKKHSDRYGDQYVAFRTVLEKLG